MRAESLQEMRGCNQGEALGTGQEGADQPKEEEKQSKRMEAHWHSWALEATEDSR